MKVSEVVKQISEKARRKNAIIKMNMIEINTSYDVN